MGLLIDILDQASLSDDIRSTSRKDGRSTYDDFQSCTRFDRTLLLGEEPALFGSHQATYGPRDTQTALCCRTDYQGRIFDFEQRFTIERRITQYACISMEYRTVRRTCIHV
jgi:hypothetical protein